MVRPDYERVCALAKDYDIIPILKEIHADTVTPIMLLGKISAISKSCFLLESVEAGTQWSRYSFLGYDPVMRICGREKRIIVEKEDLIKVVLTDKPYDMLRKILQDYRAPEIEGMPPFTGGFVGYFSYSMFSLAEKGLKIKRGEFNDFELMLFDRVIVYDHLKQKICIVVNMKTENAEENYKKAVRNIDEITEVITGTQMPSFPESDKNVRFRCNVSREEYCRLVERTKEYIREGDIFQAVISRQFTAPYKSSLINAYRVLRTTNPSPYMVYMNMGDTEIICSSPETLIQLRKGRLATFPVAGSRPRGKTDEEDMMLEKELLSDEKELAEHNMLVDLGRNDLGKISKFSSVEVTEYIKVHKYSTIMHICSRVEGDIRPECDGLSAIEAILPAGTLSGAPKFRACEIIDELESEPRGIYGGALGYIDFSGNMDTCIAIRMAVRKDNKVYVQAGGGIVADSIPEKEYEESGNKAQAVLNAICKAAEVDGL
ncbi:MAG TPA: anthranilate synthase component I [Clostridiaceae bacterium]|nr:anthranilate synthase component I [Clostridiaceae bacterium]